MRVEKGGIAHENWRIRRLRKVPYHFDRVPTTCATGLFISFLAGCKLVRRKACGFGRDRTFLCAFQKMKRQDVRAHFTLRKRRRPQRFLATSTHRTMNNKSIQASFAPTLSASSQPTNCPFHTQTRQPHHLPPRHPTRALPCDKGGNIGGTSWVLPMVGRWLPLQ